MHDPVQVTVSLTVPRSAIIPLLLQDAAKPPQEAAGDVILVPPSPSLKRPVCVYVGKQPRFVPACVAAVALKLAQGQPAVRMRPETVAKMREHLPELMAEMIRDTGEKALSKRAVYRHAAKKFSVQIAVHEKGSGHESRL